MMSSWAAVLILPRNEVDSIFLYGRDAKLEEKRMSKNAAMCSPSGMGKPWR
jgi:hypothetical protein